MLIFWPFWEYERRKLTKKDDYNFFNALGFEIAAWYRKKRTHKKCIKVDKNILVTQVSVVKGFG